jgi:hypothetical protein
MTIESSEHPFPFNDSDSARTGRHLVFMKALFHIDDPELEQALAVILDRLAEASRAAGNTTPPAST